MHPSPITLHSKLQIFQLLKKASLNKLQKQTEPGSNDTAVCHVVTRAVGNSGSFPRDGNIIFQLQLIK
jgi:hypothetical protein